ncbi:uncharacterized protein [Dermacentor albipictus]|uniref:uncharacterized protein isoform X2 n=1 Tax=Dermacentor albipictus TaxID=60249 RepID=UPI0031FDD287
MASQSMSLVHRVLMVLLLAGQDSVLAKDYITKCEEPCGGSLDVMCEVGCNCVFYQDLTMGVCRSDMSSDNILYYDDETNNSTSERNTSLRARSDSSKSLISLPVILIGRLDLTAVGL